MMRFHTPFLATTLAATLLGCSSHPSIPPAVPAAVTPNAVSTGPSVLAQNISAFSMTYDRTSKIADVNFGLPTPDQTSTQNREFTGTVAADGTATLTSTLNSGISDYQISLKCSDPGCDTARIEILQTSYAATHLGNSYPETAIVRQKTLRNAKFRSTPGDNLGDRDAGSNEIRTRVGQRLQSGGDYNATLVISEIKDTNSFFSISLDPTASPDRHGDANADRISFTGEIGTTGTVGILMGSSTGAATDGNYNTVPAAVTYDAVHFALTVDFNDDHGLKEVSASQN
jgi:hypothetical protein